MFPIITAILLVGGLIAFTYSVAQRFLLFIAAKGHDNRFDQLGKRIWGVLKLAIGQERFFKREIGVGLMHATIFWGFCVISLRTITLFGMGFTEDFVLPGLGGFFGIVYNASLQVFLVLVSLAIVYALYRRICVKPSRINLSVEGVVILSVILSLMVSDILFEAAQIARLDIPSHGAFVSAFFAGPLQSLSDGTLLFIGGTSFLIHLALIVGFMNFLPYGKHFHIVTSLPNVLHRQLRPYGQLQSINLEDESNTTFGADRIEQFSWKNYLDWFTCTECGRCTSQCPAYNSDKPLNPKELTTTLRDFLYRKQDKLLDKINGKEMALDDFGLIPDETPLLGESNVLHETIWSCTTCRACEEACPVFIEYVGEIVDMRRNLVLMQGSFPPEVQNVFVNMERNYNPWGIGASERGSWAKEVGVKTLAEDNEVEYLYFGGCAANFDERNKKVAQNLSLILQSAGIKFGILGTEEKCTGDSARRLGNEYLAQMLMKENISTFDKYKVKKVITSCPHCFNSIKNEFPQFGGNYEVIHHTDLLKDLIDQGLVKPEKAMEKEIVYHDSCYLGRYNEIYEAPRDILKSIPGVTLKEAENSRDKGRCCGAGGGRMWIEENTGKRVNEMRLADLQETGATTAATACPFCKIMIGDAINQTGQSEKINTFDVVEILAQSLDLKKTETKQIGT